MIQLKLTEPDHRVGGYASWNIPADLKSMGQDIWIYCSPDDATPPPHRLLPTSESSLIIRRVRRGPTAYSDVRLEVSGPTPIARLFSPNPREEFIALRLKPEISGAGLGLFPQEFEGRGFVPVPRSVERHFGPLLEMARYCEVDVVARSLHQMAGKDLNDRRILKSIAHTVAESMRRSAGRSKVSQLAASFRISERHLRRSFQDVTGIGLKQYARRLRLSHAIGLADKEEVPDWPGIAVAAGFTDQAHFANDCRNMTGAPPTTLLRERRIEADFYNTA